MCSKLVAADAHHQQVVLFSQLRQISKTANRRNATNFNASRLPIIYKGAIVFKEI